MASHANIVQNNYSPPHTHTHTRTHTHTHTPTHTHTLRHTPLRSPFSLDHSDCQLDFWNRWNNWSISHHGSEGPAITDNCDHTMATVCHADSGPDPNDPDEYLLSSWPVMYLPLSQGRNSSNVTVKAFFSTICYEVDLAHLDFSTADLKSAYLNYCAKCTPWQTPWLDFLYRPLFGKSPLAIWEITDYLSMSKM